MTRNFIQWNEKYPEQIDAVLCKGCGAPVRSMVVDDRLRTSEKIGETLVIRERLVMANLPHYAEVEIEMEDGSKHATACCASCADRATDEDLEQWYEADLDMMDEENRRAKVKATDQMARLRARRPKKKEK